MVRRVKRPVAHRQGKKNRKFGRNELKCKRYRLERRHEKSHIRRIRRHIERYCDHTHSTLEALNRYIKMLTS